MILPIRAYGDPVLRRKGKDIPKDYPGLKELIENMFETMRQAHGVGLAAPQIGLDIRLFVVDCTPFVEDEDYDDIKDQLKDFKKVFINARAVDRAGDPFKFNEGCLSIPTIHEDVVRPTDLTLEYYDENFEKHTETFSDIRARVIQHEYDHIDGILFTDKLSPLKKKVIAGRLKKITLGQVDVDYKMRFPK